MESLLYVGVGGFCGANARYLLSLWVNEFLSPRFGLFPYGTLLVNVLGSLGLAVFGVWFSARAGLSAQLQWLIGAGFFGAFTTFSTFANESIDLASRGGMAQMLLNLLLNNAACLLAVALGLWLGQRLFGLGG
ncbi:MAG: fluoride efflux transporter CrcB [Chloroflexi bacterium]|nr:fluoride efflux transporter CrcB [Chloroflexota bacterium]MCY3582594.1 fluoride efflux transporter CrcB [Chloroflexota bacterium]MCY3715278.1 fluoride efflux transporter CrcB [Chloroflexota bacterium]MDE2652123.1 fluoride efflux transporter CrcB [Chloroflexota bacterium]MYC56104.1 fluoride efflux transporter CrcB [Chloroflexota bacterium]